jgi:hypothetical protein
VVFFTHAAKLEANASVNVRFGSKADIDGPSSVLVFADTMPRL